MYRILIACVLAIQVQSRPFGSFIFGRTSPFINPWLLPSPTSEPISQFSPAGIFGMIRIHQNAYSPFSQYLSSVNRQPPPLPARIYGRIETQSPLSYQSAPVYGPPTAPSFIPSNEFFSADQAPNAPREYGLPNYKYPMDSFPSTSGPQLAPAYGTQAPSYGTQAPVFGTPAPVYGTPAPVYGPAPQTFGAPQNIPSNTFIPGPFNRYEPSDYGLPSPNYGPPFQPGNGGSQLPVAPFATNVLPLIPSINLPGPAYLPPATVNQQDSTPKVDTSPPTIPTTLDSEIDANELATQTESTKLPTMVRDGAQTTQEGTSVSITASETATTESSIESTSPLSTTLQSNDSTSESSSTTLGSTDAESTDASESTAPSSSTTTDFTTSSTESYTNDESNAV